MVLCCHALVVPPVPPSVPQAAKVKGRNSAGAVRKASADSVQGLLAALHAAADTALGQQSSDDDHTFVVLRRLA